MLQQRLGKITYTIFYMLAYWYEFKHGFFFWYKITKLGGHFTDDLRILVLKICKSYCAILIHVATIFFLVHAFNYNHVCYLIRKICPSKGSFKSSSISKKVAISKLALLSIFHLCAERVFVELALPEVKCVFCSISSRTKERSTDSSTDLGFYKCKTCAKDL